MSSFHARLSSVSWLSFTVLAAHMVVGAGTAAINDGLFSIKPVYPTTCTASSFTYSSTLVRPTGAIVIDGDFKLASEWTITISDGLQLYDVGAGSQGSIERYVTNHNNGTWTFDVPSGYVSEPISGHVGPKGCDQAHRVLRKATTPSPTTPTSWSAGACTTSMLTDSTVTCNGTPKPPLVKSTAICKCPGGNFRKHGGNNSPCGTYTTFQGDLEIATNRCSDASSTLTMAPSSPLIASATNKPKHRRMNPSSSGSPVSRSSGSGFGILNHIAPNSHNSTITATKTASVYSSISSSAFWPSVSSLEDDTKSNIRFEASRKLKRPAPTTETRSFGPSCTAAGVPQYSITVAAKIPCGKPVTDVCTPNHNVNLTIEQWQAYSTDEFLEAWVKNNTNGGRGLMTTFISEFIGEGSTAIVCNADPKLVTENDCLLSHPCDDVKTTGPYKYQATFVLQSMINFSNTITQTIYALSQAGNDLLLLGGLLNQWVSIFEPDPGSTPEKWKKNLPVSSTVLVLVASIFIFWAAAQPEIGAFINMAIIGPLIGSNGFEGLLVNIFNTEKEAPDNFEYDQTTKNGEAVENFISAQTKLLQTIHDGYWNDGGGANHSMVDLLKGGSYFGTLAAADSHSALNTNMAAYFENMVLTSLTNNWLITANIYIVFIPYGTVWSGYEKYTSFTQEDCETDWFKPGGSRWADSVVGSCTAGDPVNGEGMAVFANAGGQEKASWFSRDFTYPYKGERYNPQDVLSSSLQAYLQHGFGYNITSALASNIIDDHSNFDKLNKELNYGPSTPGIYNLPVCRIADLTVVPNGDSVSQGLMDYSQVHPCSCMGNAVNYTDPNGTVSFFRDNISDRIHDELMANIKPDKTCPVYT